MMVNLPKKRGRSSRAERLRKLVEEARLKKLAEERDRSSMVKMAQTKDLQPSKPTETRTEAQC